MPAGGDLGFSYVVLLVVFVVPVFGFVVRRKWRLSVARSEEIKRLLVLASEEAARAELEASIGYASISYASAGYATSPEPISRPTQYQCAVCFCPTTTRCARCKSARYCSGKCQIIHWRQGHKEECRPFSPSYLSNDAGGGSSQKALRQEEFETHGNSFETEEKQCAKSVKNFPEETAWSKSDYSAEVFCGNDGNGVEGIADGKATKTTSLNSERPNGHGSSNNFPDRQNRPPTPKRTILVDSTDPQTSSSNKLNQIRSERANHITRSGSTSSSGWSVDSSNDSSFSEPSTPSSGVWEGIIDSSGPGIDALDDSAQSSSTATRDASMHNSHSSSKIPYSNRNGGSLVDVQGSGTKTVIPDDAHLTSLGKNKPIVRAVLLEEINEDASKGRQSPLLRPKKSDHVDGHGGCDLPVSRSREPRYCSSSAAQPTSIAGGPSKVNSLQSLGREKLNLAVNQTSPTPHSLESKEGGSLSSSATVAHLSSSARKPSLQGAIPREVDSAHAIATTSECAGKSPNARNGLKASMLKVVDQLIASKPSQHCLSGVGSEITGRYNNKGLFSYELFVKLYNWNKIQLQPCGLINCGNSCYANAVLQCMAYTPPLTGYLLHGLHSKSCERKEWCFTCEFESLILKSKEGTSPLSPIGILSQIQSHGSHLGNGREEDAHEFLRYAIDTMQSICLKEARVNSSTSFEEETTLIGLTFGGYLRSKIKCIKCGGKSEQYEKMMDLTVEIEGDIGTLEEALRKFSGTEILDGENKYLCSRCRSYQRAKKKLTVLEAPNILTVVLKRFQSGKFGKLNKSIQFPEILDLAPYMSGTSDKSPIYRLYGVVVHLDSMNATFSGHYVCYVKNFQNKWFKIDDSVVNAVELESVLTKKAYMLLYARCSPRAPKVLRNSLTPHDPRKPKNSLFKPRSTGHWDASNADLLNGHARIECIYPNGKILEEDSSSDNSSFFSEGCSCSTETSNMDSSIADDYFDQLFSDPGQNLNSSWKNSSDSDTSSTSSSSSPSPMYSRHSLPADSECYSSSGYPETSGFRNADSDMDGNGFWTRLPSRSSNREVKASVPFLYSDPTEHCRKLASSSCRETDSDRLGSANPSDRKPGVTSSSSSSSRSTRERKY